MNLPDMPERVCDGPESVADLETAIWALIEDDPLSDEQIALTRDYLRQWIMAPCHPEPMLDELRRRIDELTTTEAIRRWLDDALRMGIDPL